MEYKSYNKKLFTVLAAIFGCIILLNYFVNPYNIFKQRIFVKTLLKPEAKIQERITKPIGLKIDNRKIDAIFFGTSRTDLAINKEYYKKITGKEAENIAIGGLHFYEMFDIIDIALKIHPEIKNIYIGLDYETFLKGRADFNDNRAAITKNPKLEPQETAIALLCLKTTANSVWTIIKTLSGSKKRMFYSNGVKYIFVNNKIESEFEKLLPQYDKSYGSARLDYEKMNNFSRFCNKIAIDGREITLFIMPTHISEFYFIYKTGNWSEYSKWKEELVKIGPVYDFQYPNSITTEPIKPDMTLFFDPSHCTYLAGNKIIEDIALKKAGFARILTKENVTKMNLLTKQEIINWKNTNKETAEFINRLANKNNGGNNAF